MTVGKKRQDESLEALEERARARLAEEEEDEEAALGELIEVMVPNEALPQRGTEEGPGERAERRFTCTSCRLVFSRTCLADAERMLCVDCVRDEARRRAAVAPGEPAPWTVEAPCPACGQILMVPEREDAACGFFCSGCGAHGRRWEGRLHLLWNHRYRPSPVPKES